MDDIEKKIRASGYKPSTIQHILIVMRRLQRLGIDWAAVRDDDLLPFRGERREVVERVRMGLRCAFTDAEARRRWPKFFTSTAVYGAHVDMLRVSREIAAIPGVNMDLVDLNIVRRAMKQGNSDGLHEEARTLYMRGWCTAFDQFAPVPPRLRALMLLRWCGDQEILEVFRRMGQSAVDHGGRNDLLPLALSFYELCVLLQPSGNVSGRIKDASRDHILELVTSQGSQFLKGRASRLFYHFARCGRWCGFVVAWRDWPRVTAREAGYTAKRRRRERNSLTGEELQRLFDVTKADARDDALLRYYIHTSRRRASACELLVDDVWDATAGAVRTEGVVLEKFNRRVTFPIDDKLGAALTRWIRESGVTKFVFPALMNNDQKWNSGGPRSWLRAICKRVGITGSHVFVHGLRHTVATLLHRSGNKIEDIAAYLGHRHVNTTQIYIDRSVSRPQDRMSVPWLTNAADLAGLRLSSASIAGIAEEVLGGSVAHDASSSSSSSTSTSAIGSVMANANQQQQALVAALTRRLAARDAEVHHLTETYNFIVGEVLTDAMRLRVGEWQRQHPLDGGPMRGTAVPTWQDNLTRLYTNVDEQDTESDASEAGNASDDPDAVDGSDDGGSAAEGSDGE